MSDSPAVLYRDVSGSYQFNGDVSVRLEIENLTDEQAAFFRLLPSGGRSVGWSLWGLVLGRLVGAAGLTSPSLLLTDLVPGQGLGRQVLHGAVGVLAAPVTFMWPVATLFAGMFLWKVGLAHAGLATFFCAAAVSPHRISLYREVWPGRQTTLRVLELAAAALIAGLAVAALFGLTGLDIHYKLIPGQLWRP